MSQLEPAGLYGRWASRLVFMNEVVGRARRSLEWQQDVSTPNLFKAAKAEVQAEIVTRVG